MYNSFQQNSYSQNKSDSKKTVFFYGRAQQSAVCRSEPSVLLPLTGMATADLARFLIFIVGSLKYLVHAKKPEEMTELKNAICTAATAGIDTVFLDRSLGEFKLRMELVINERRDTLSIEIFMI